MRFELIVIGFLCLVLTSGALIYISGGSQITDSDTEGLLSVHATETIDEERLSNLIHLQINKARTSRGLHPLDRDRELDEVAVGHSMEMARYRYFSHTNRSDFDFVQRGWSHGYECKKEYRAGITEVIFKGHYRYSSMTNHSGYVFYEDEEELAKGVIKSWLASEGHRMTILSDDIKRGGVGIGVNEYGEVYITYDIC